MYVYACDIKWSTIHTHTLLQWHTDVGPGETRVSLYQPGSPEPQGKYLDIWRGAQSGPHNWKFPNEACITIVRMRT